MPLYSVIFIIPLFAYLALCQESSIKIGLIFPLTSGEVSEFPYGNAWWKTANAAAQSINNQRIIPGYTLDLVVYDTQDSLTGTIISAFQCAAVDHCVGAIGDVYSSTSELVQYVLQNYSVPQISPTATASILANKTLFPTFLRTVPDDTVSGPLIAHVVSHFNWTKVAIIAGSDTYSNSLYNSFVASTVPLGIKIAAESTLDPLKPDYKGSVATAKNAYVQVIVLIAERMDAQQVLIEGYNQGIVGRDFVWIGDETLEQVNSSAFPTVDALLGTLAVRPAATANTNLSHQYLQQMADLGINMPMGSFLYDAVYTYAYTFANMLQANATTPWENRTLLLSTLKASNFTGVTGQIQFNQSGNRIPYGCDVLNWQPGGNVTSVAFVSWQGEFTQLSPIIWSDNTTNVPADYLTLIRHAPPIIVQIMFSVVAVIMTLCSFVSLIVALVTAFGATNIPNKWGPLAVHIPSTIGSILGYTSIILIMLGVSKLSCKLAPVFADLSLLICGGVLTFSTLRDFVEAYSTNTEERCIGVSSIKALLFSLLACCICVNVGILVFAIVYERHNIKLFKLEKNFYEYHCHFGPHALIYLPAILGVLFAFAIIATLLKIVVTASVVQDSIVRTSKADTVNGVLHALIILALVIGTVLLGSLNATQTQIDITIGVIIIIANIPVPFNLIVWIFRLQQGYTPVETSSERIPINASFSTNNLLSVNAADFNK